MNLDSLFADAAAAGLTLYLKDDGTLSATPAKALSTDLKARIQEVKPEVIAELTRRRFVSQPYRRGYAIPAEHAGHDAVREVQAFRSRYLPVLTGAEQGRIPAEPLDLPSNGRCCENPQLAVKRIFQKTQAIASAALRQQRPLIREERQFLADAQAALNFLQERFG